MRPAKQLSISSSKQQMAVFMNYVHEIVHELFMEYVHVLCSLINMKMFINRVHELCS